jgi:hypothetical protein
MKPLICAADDCNNPVELTALNRLFCSLECANRTRVRRFRERHKVRPNGGGGRGKRQRHLFPKTILAKAKPPKSVRTAKQEPLFSPDGAGLHATFGGASPVLADGSLSDNGTLNKYSVKFGQKPSHRIAAAILLCSVLTLISAFNSPAYALPGPSVGSTRGVLRGNALTPAKTVLRKVVHRKPVPFRPYTHVPEYLLVYCVETLECGHTVETHPQADPLIAVRRRCQECDRKVVSIDVGKKFVAVPVRKVA